MGVFINKNGDKFKMTTAKDFEISVLEGGYLITKDGQFIPVKDDQDHSDIFSQYINKFYGATQPRHYETTEAIVTVVNDGNIVYMGKKFGDNPLNVVGAFIILLPYEELTPEQKEALRKLISTNVGKVFKNPIVNLTCEYLDGTSAESVLEQLDTQLHK